MDLTEAETVSMGVLSNYIWNYFYLIAPFLGRQGSKMANNIGNDLKRRSRKRPSGRYGRPGDRSCGGVSAYEDISGRGVKRHVPDAYHRHIHGVWLQGAVIGSKKEPR